MDIHNKHNILILNKTVNLILKDQLLENYPVYKITLLKDKYMMNQDKFQNLLKKSFKINKKQNNKNLIILDI